jgi:hypothetical protein
MIQKFLASLYLSNQRLLSATHSLDLYLSLLSPIPIHYPSLLLSARLHPGDVGSNEQAAQAATARAAMPGGVEQPRLGAGPRRPAVARRHAEEALDAELEPLLRQN